jgi:hypothetical protein
MMYQVKILSSWSDCCWFICLAIFSVTQLAHFATLASVSNLKYSMTPTTIVRHIAAGFFGRCNVVLYTQMFDIAGGRLNQNGH